MGRAVQPRSVAWVAVQDELFKPVRFCVQCSVLNSFFLSPVLLRVSARSQASPLPVSPSSSSAGTLPGAGPCGALDGSCTPGGAQAAECGACGAAPMGSAWGAAPGMGHNSDSSSCSSRRCWEPFSPKGASSGAFLVQPGHHKEVVATFTHSRFPAGLCHRPAEMFLLLPHLGHHARSQHHEHGGRMVAVTTASGSQGLCLAGRLQPPPSPAAGQEQWSWGCPMGTPLCPRAGFSVGNVCPLCGGKGGFVPKPFS